MSDYLGIGVCPELVSAPFQIAAQYGMIVDLAVEDYLDEAIFASEWLVSAGDVNDAQAPHADAYSISHVRAFVIWAAVYKRVGHALQDRSDDLLSQLRVNQSCNSAHGMAPSVNATAPTKRSEGLASRTATPYCGLSAAKSAMTTKA